MQISLISGSFLKICEYNQLKNAKHILYCEQFSFSAYFLRALQNLNALCNGKNAYHSNIKGRKIVRNQQVKHSQIICTSKYFSACLVQNSVDNWLLRVRQTKAVITKAESQARAERGWGFAAALCWDIIGNSISWKLSCSVLPRAARFHGKKSLISSS